MNPSIIYGVGNIYFPIERCKTKREKSAELILYNSIRTESVGVLTSADFSFTLILYNTDKRIDVGGCELRLEIIFCSILI